MKSQPSTLASFSRSLLATFLFAVCQAAAAGVIAQRDGAVATVFANAPTVASFTTTSAFSNVSIEAKLSSLGFRNDGAGTFYLTTSIGSGTMPADEVARLVLTNVPFATFDMGFSVMFSGLTLAADTYYLVAAADQGAGGLGWVQSNSPTESTATGVTIGTDMYGTTGLAAYAPASSLTASPLGLLFRVSGDAATSVPEPSGLALLATALAALTLTRRRSVRT